LKRTSTVIGFLFFIFDLEYLIRVQSSKLRHAKMNPTSCLFGSRFAYAPAIQSKIEQHFAGFFHQINVRQPIGRQDSMQTVIR
jgi:hypothetical protein